MPFHYKFVSVGGKTIPLLGYEPFCLLRLVKLYPLGQIYYGRNAFESRHFLGPVPTFKYLDPTRDRRRVYYPDFVLPLERRVIEVKSWYTYKLDLATNMAKRDACIKEGYSFEFQIFTKDGQMISK